MFSTNWQLIYWGKSPYRQVGLVLNKLAARSLGRVSVYAGRAVFSTNWQLVDWGESPYRRVGLCSQQTGSSFTGESLRIGM